MSTSEKKRKILFIQKKFQLRSILIVVSIIVASGLMSGVLLYFLLASELSSQLQIAHQQLQNTWDNLAPAIIFGNALTIIITGLAAAIAVLYQSHKIAGPMYRLQSICEEVSQGNYQPLTSLRKADQLTALAASFEEMVESLRDRQQQQETLLSDARAVVNSLLKETDDKKQIDMLNDLLIKLEQSS